MSFKKNKKLAALRSISASAFIFLKIFFAQHHRRIIVVTRY